MMGNISGIVEDDLIRERLVCVVLNTRNMCSAQCGGIPS